VQDLQFDTASTRLKATPDGQYLIASGIYPPQVRVYELSELSLKFERHLTSEIVNFQVLGEDYSKLAFLCADRSVILHAKFGSYYSTRIPRMGRDLAYDRWSCDLLLAASSPEVYRLNLEQGRFLAPLATRSPGINVIGRSPVHGLIACGGEDGALECFDLRQKAPVGRINAVAPTGNSDQEVTSLRFDESEGLLLAAGTSAGQVLLYDLRSSIPLRIKDHMCASFSECPPIIDCGVVF
jgi:ribosome biogenesis protein ENP2